MNNLFEQFLLEARENLDEITDNVIKLEASPGDRDVLEELFRIVHTLKGSSGLFDLPEVTGLLHTAEDLMGQVRQGRVAFTPEMVDQFLAAMDLVGAMLRDVEDAGQIAPEHKERARETTIALEQLCGSKESQENGNPSPQKLDSHAEKPHSDLSDIDLRGVPESFRMEAYRKLSRGESVLALRYVPEEAAFFKGEDPFLLVRRVPGVFWGRVSLNDTLEDLADFDCYACKLNFELLVSGEKEDVADHFRYVSDQVRMYPVLPDQLVFAIGESQQRGTLDDFAVETLLVLLEDGRGSEIANVVDDLLGSVNSESHEASLLRWIRTVADVSPDRRDILRKLMIQLVPPDETDGPVGNDSVRKGISEAGTVSASSHCDGLVKEVLAAQQRIVEFPDDVGWLSGRIQACGATLKACLISLGLDTRDLDGVVSRAVKQNSAAPLKEWLAKFVDQMCNEDTPRRAFSTSSTRGYQIDNRERSTDGSVRNSVKKHETSAPRMGNSSFVSSVSSPTSVIKVDQTKVDRLMALIGELVVAKNALPYLASKAEDVYGVRQLAQEIKSHYSAVDRLSKELQDTILQVRMVPVGLVFQRFPRLVRDLSRKLGKQVRLELRGEETEVDKMVIDTVSEPLVHLIRNSLDHGIELPAERRRVGKSEEGKLIVAAYQQGDKVVIEVSDDGKGIDSNEVRKKAYERGIVKEDQLEHMSDDDVLRLVFEPGFSTAEQVTDVSGRGVGMDAVQKAVNRVGGAVSIATKVGEGTTIRLSLPLTVAVTNVMMVRSAEQTFGVPVDKVIETARIPLSSTYELQGRRVGQLRNKVLSLLSLNAVLRIGKKQLLNEHNELAVLVVQAGAGTFGLVVDEFVGSTDVVLKPMPEGFSNLNTYAGTAILGDGSLLLILNVEGILQWGSNTTGHMLNS